MTELQQYLAMLKRAGIAYGLGTDAEGHSIVMIAEGYSGFYFEHEFDADGQLVKVGAYEA